MERSGIARLLALGVIVSGMSNAAGADDFAPARQAGGFVYVSAVSGHAAATGNDIKQQTQSALDGVSARLKAGGSSLAMAASVNVFLRRAEDFAGLNDVYRTYWKKDPPARTTIVATGGDPESLVEIAAVGIPIGGERRVIQPADWMPSPNPYSYGILSGDTLFLAGLVSRNGKDNQVAPGDIKTQTLTALENGGAILKAAGMTHADVVQSRVYITDAVTFPDMNATYRGFFAKYPPARATVVSPLMSPQYLVEVMLVAVKGTRDVFTTPNADGTPGTPNPNLSSAVRIGKRLWLSGMLGNGKDDVATQTRGALDRLGRTLKAAGFAWSDVREGVVYVTKAQDRDAVARVWAGQFPKDKPAGVAVLTPLVAADGLVEIMLSAAKN
jgi:2-iminobutanoate/2-iminopropanoate deaminase